MEKTHLVYSRVIGLNTKTMNPKVFNSWTPVILRTVLLSDMWLLSASMQKKRSQESKGQLKS